MSTSDLTTPSGRTTRTSTPPKQALVALSAILAILLLSLGVVTWLLQRPPAPRVYEGTPLQGAAPNFRLTDQQGRAVQLSDFRGKAVLLTFMDSKCRDTCSITSVYLREAYRALGEDASSAVFLAVNVNPAAARPADVAAATRRFGLGEVPSWHFLTGGERELRRAWKDYKVVALGPGEHPARPGHPHPHADANVPHEHLVQPGWDVGEVSHGSGVFVIDPDGRQRWYVLPPREPSYEGPALDELLVRHVRGVVAE